jgi:hypothetical protein
VYLVSINVSIIMIHVTYSHAGHGEQAGEDGGYRRRRRIEIRRF